MELIEITADEYENLVGDNVPVFYQMKFLELNKYKVDKVRYFLGKNPKNRIAFAVGEKDKQWRAPFSSPFSGFVFLHKTNPTEYIWEFISLLNDFAKQEGIKDINIYLPSDIYDSQNNARIINALLGNGYAVQFEDINYSFDLKTIDLDTYSANIQYNARKNLRIGQKSDLSLFHCRSYEEKEEAYDTIKINRESRGFPLRMTKEQLMETIEIVDHDFFLVKKDEMTIAAAVVYHVTNTVAQVVYWGEIPNVGSYKPINYLSFELIKYYKSLGYSHLDIGISTEEGKPNYGLCSFKESIGCIASTKFRFQISL